MLRRRSRFSFGFGLALGTGGAAAAPATITQDGLVATFSLAGQVGQYADGSYWVVAPPGGVVLTAVAIAGGEVSNLYVGGVMVDPQDMTKQGFDDRQYLATGLGPLATYDASVAHALPLTVDHYADGSPKTIHLYRGRTTVESGGGYSGCYACVEITVVSSAKSSAHIKPTGLYVATGKPEYTTADINYSLFTPYTIPAAAVAAEPDWDTLANMYFVRPLVQWGQSFLGAAISPTQYQEAYPANNGVRFSQMLLGAVSTSTHRNDLINRIVRDGLMVHSSIALNSSVWAGGGGFGAGGGRFMRFFAGKFLNVAAMLTDAGTATNTIASGPFEFFQEDDDGSVYVGATRVLFGTKQSSTYPTPPYGGNHDIRDPAGLVEPHMLALVSGTAQAGGASTITLAAGTSATISVGDRIYITGGTGSAATAAQRLGIVTGYNSGTKVATMQDAWTIQPDNTTTYDVYNGGGYQIIATQRVTGASAAVVLAGLSDAWDADLWMAYVKRYVDTDNGLLTPRYPTDAAWQALSADLRKFFDTTNWTKSFWTDATAIWPPILSSQSGTKTGSTTADLAVTTDTANGALYTVVTTSATAPTAAQVKAGQNQLGAAAPFAGSQVISSTGAKTVSATGLTASTTYYTYFMHENASGYDSMVRAASSFATDAAGVTFTSVAFDGTNNYLTRGANFDGLIDGEAFTFVCRINPTDGGNRVLLWDAQDNILIYLNTANVVQGYMWGAAQRLGFQTTATVLNADGMLTLFIAARTTSGSEAFQVYKGGTDITPGAYTHATGNMDFTPTDWGVFGSVAGATLYNGSAEFVWFNNVYYDVSSGTVRDKWLAANINADGSGPGAQPKLFKFGNAAAWNGGTNLGTGGNLTMHGAVA